MLNQSFRASIDPFNGYYYFAGALPGHSGTLHQIDLVNLTISSSTEFPSSYHEYSQCIAFDFLRNRILYDFRQSIRSLDLNTNTHVQLAEREDVNFNVSELGSGVYSLLIQSQDGALSQSHSFVKP